MDKSAETIGQRLMAEMRHMSIEVEVATDMMTKIERENERLWELVRMAHACKTNDGCCEDCWGDYGECPVETEMKELGIEVE